MRASSYLPLALMIAMLATSACSSHESSQSSGSTQQGAATSGSISRDDAISGHWDEIRENLNGTETVDACSSESGSCYNLDADIDNGEITRIRFSNGGSLRFSAEINESGDASDTDENGDSWDFTLDMNSSIVDNAVDEWAKANGYEIQ